MTGDEAADTLRAAGLRIDAKDIVIERRGDRFAAMLPETRIAWFPATKQAREHLAIERRVLGLIAERCTYRAPRVLFTGADGWDLRALVPGEVAPFAYADRLKADAALQLRLSAYLGAVLAEQHTRITQADVAGWLPRDVTWPPPIEEITAKLPTVIPDATLLDRAMKAIEAFHAVAIAETERALVHTDLGLHNMAVDPVSGLPNGVFDFGSAAWADRHFDFRYLMFGAIHDTLLDATMRAYTEATGFELSRLRILLYNAAAAIGHLADRAGFGPAASVAGRTLAQDLAWTNWALRRSGY